MAHHYYALANIVHASFIVTFCMEWLASITSMLHFQFHFVWIMQSVDLITVH